MPDAPAFPDLACHVYAAADLPATVGANIGDGLAADDGLSPGDTYRLRAGATALRVALAPAGSTGTVQRIADGSEIGRPGEALHIAARATLMAPDGHRVEVLLLHHADAPADYVLPLAPMALQTDYTLLATDAPPENLRLSEVLLASFGPGTRITLPDGTQRQIEALVPGDRVLTRDHGPQPVRWAGKVTLRGFGGFAPVLIPAGTMGNAGDLIVSQQHRLFVYHRRLARLTGMPELLIPAGLLVDGTTITLREGGFADYHALVFDRHEIIYAEGIPAESLMVSDATLARLPEDFAADVRRAAPDLAQSQHFGMEAGPDLLAAVGRDAILGRDRSG